MSKLIKIDGKVLAAVKSTAVASLCNIGSNKYDPQEQVTIAWMKAVLNEINKQLKLDLDLELEQELDLEGIEEYTNL